MRPISVFAALIVTSAYGADSRGQEPKKLTTVNAPHRGFFSLTFSNDGLWFATSGAGKDYAVLWDSKTWKEIARFSHGLRYPLTSVAFAPDSKTLATVGGHDQTVKLWDIRQQKEIRSWNLGMKEDVPWKIQFSPDGNWLAVCHDRGTVQLWNPHDGTKMRAWNAHDKLKDMDIAPDGKLATAGLDSFVRLWDPITGKRIAEAEFQKRMFFHVAFSADGKQVAASADRNAVGLSRVMAWNSPQLKTSETLMSFIGMRVGHLAFSRDGRWLACESDGNQAFLLDLKTKKRRRIGTAMQPERVAFSSNSRFLVLGLRDSTIDVWDLGPPKKPTP